MLLFICDDKYEQCFQTKQKEKTKVIVQYQKERGSTYGAYCFLYRNVHFFIILLIDSRTYTNTPIYIR